MKFFGIDSMLAALWVRKIKQGAVEKKDVPNLYNLRDIVYEILDTDDDTAAGTDE